MILVSFDLETYPPMRNDDRFGMVMEETVAALRNELARKDIVATFFCTGEFAERHASLVRSLASDGHEIGNHTMNHVVFRDTTEDDFSLSIAQCDELVTKIVGRKPIGFRAPNGNVPLGLVRILESLGYSYDSSLCRTYIPGWYEGALCPTIPYYPSCSDVRKRDSRSSCFVEIPIGRFPFVPIPLGGFFIAAIPLLSAKLIREMCADEKAHVMYIHPFDLLDSGNLPTHLWDRIRVKGRLKSIVGQILGLSGSKDMRLERLVESSFPVH